MGLTSRNFKGDTKLEACLTSDAAHVTTGATGDHVAKIQAALILVDTATIDSAELQSKTYGASTTAAVLAYKQKRRIINQSYQTTADSIVGKMTIASLDREMLIFEQRVRDLNSCAGLRFLSTRR